MNNVRSEVGLARQEKLKRHDGSEDQVNAIAAETSVKASLPSLHDKPYPFLRSPSDLEGLHIPDRSNQRHVLLQHYASKRLYRKREASGLHNL